MCADGSFVGANLGSDQLLSDAFLSKAFLKSPELFPKVALGVVAGNRRHIRRCLPNLRQAPGKPEGDDSCAHGVTAACSALRITSPSMVRSI